jgi:putative endonuclease
MTQKRLRLGRAAENLVAARLAAAHWEVVERNARSRYGELDLVALDGGTLVFLEVKAGRQGADFGPERPLLAIGPRKQRQVRRLATAWIAERRGSGLRYDEIRFDAVGVTFDRTGRVSAYEHMEGAF